MKKIYSSKEERWAAYREKYRFAGKKPDFQLMVDRCKEPSLKKWYPEFYKQVSEWVDMDIPFREKLYLFQNNLKEKPVCLTCGKPVRFKNHKLGYRTFCCYKCSNSSELNKEKRKETCLERFGTIAPAGCEEVKAKTRATCLKKYGVEHPSKSKEWYSKTVKTRIERYGGVGNASPISKQKYQQTCLERYGTVNPQASKEFRESHNFVSPFTRPEIQEKCKRKIIERCGGIYSEDLKGATSCPEVREHIYQIKKERGTLNSSNIEKQFEEYLKSNNIKYISQYKSDKYPWMCDFYIVDLNLYVELQSSWTHGEHPFDEEQDKERLELWKKKAETSKYFQNAIKTWTIRDVAKRTKAKENHIRYLEIFTNNPTKAIEEYERFISELQ